MSSGKVTLALLQFPALFHYGETVLTTTVARDILGQRISYLLKGQSSNKMFESSGVALHPVIRVPI